MPNNGRTKEGFSLGTPQTRLQQRMSVGEAEMCLQHASALELVCMSCGSKLLCGGCLTGGSHMGHDVRGVERTRAAIAGQLQEWVVRLKNKSEVLDIIHIQFENNKSHLSLTAKRYKDQLKEQFDIIAIHLQQRLLALQDSVESFVRQSLQEMNQLMLHIRAIRKEIEKIQHRYDRASIQMFSAQELAAQVHHNRSKISMLLDQTDIIAFKQKLIEPQWKLSNQIISQIRNKIDSISILFKDKDKDAKGLGHKRRSRKELRLMEEREKSESKLKVSSSSHYLVPPTFTPKHNSRQKKVKLKRSPEVALLKKRKKSAKMISMPASPAKEAESTYLITPELSRKKLFKKK